MFSRRMKTGSLATLCRRLATSLDAGVDVRRVMAREAESARGRVRHALHDVSHAVNRGTPLPDALEEHPRVFPRLMRDLARIGDQTGHLPETFRQLAEHYDHQLAVRRVLLSVMAYPLFQVKMAVSAGGFLILALGWVANSTGQTADEMAVQTGIPLVGMNGLIIYITGIVLIALTIYLVFQAMVRGFLWTRPIQWLLMKLPFVGRALENLALAQFSWALQLTLNTSLPLRQAVDIALRSTRNHVFYRHSDQIWSSIRRGSELHSALRETNVFPPVYLDMFEVGEESGRMVETLSVLAKEYQEEARRSLIALARGGGRLLWVFVSGAIIIAIFKLFTTIYLGQMQRILEM